MQIRDFEKDGKYYLETDYEIGRLCWAKDSKDHKICGHLCGYICDNFETMDYKLCIQVGGSTYMVDKIFKTEKEADKI
jgi:hypothetical protein